MLKRSLFLIPARTELYQAKLGFYLLVAALGMFFIASLITYVAIRNTPMPIETIGVDPAMELAATATAASTNGDLALEDIPLALHRGEDSLPLAAPRRELKPLRVPPVFIYSTVLLIGISAALHFAVLKVHQERQRSFKRWLALAMVFALAFLIVQNLGMIELVGVHLQHSLGDTKMYGIAYALAFIHALHVYGGLIFLGVVLARARRNQYDHERHWGVDICAGYWHFLDVVWIAMLVTFVLAG